MQTCPASPSPLLSRLAPEGHLEHYYAEKIEGYLGAIQELGAGTPAHEIRSLDRLLRIALRELRDLQYDRISAQATLLRAA